MSDRPCRDCGDPEVRHETICRNCGCKRFVPMDAPIPLDTPLDAEQQRKVIAFINARADSIRALRACTNPENNPGDYYRWLGYAGSRRELAQDLGLPIPGGWL